MISGKWRRFAGAFLLFGSIAAPEETQLEQRAKDLVTNFMAKKFDRVVAQLDSATRDEWPETKMLGVWLTLKTQVGDFQSIVKTRREKAPSARIIVVTCRFTQVTWDVRVAFDSKGRVSGLFFVPPKTQRARARKRPRLQLMRVAVTESKAPEIGRIEEALAVRA